MNNTDMSTLGGRIRSSRQKMGWNLAEFGNKIGVSTNYVSAIERNVKNPSVGLLKKIADTTGSSYEWLRNGGDEDITPPEDISQPASDIHFLDVPFFIKILLAANPAITKATIATILAVDDSELDEILAGNTEYDPAWEACLPALIRQIADISDLQKKLHTVQDYLLQAESKNFDFGLIRMFRDSLAEKFKSDFIFSPNDRISGFKRNTSFPRLIVPYYERHFICEEKETGGVWHIWSLAWHSRLGLKDLLTRIQYSSDLPCENIVIAVNRENDFNSLRDANWKASSPWDDSSPSCPNLFLMLINTDTMQAIDIVSIEI